MRAFLSGGLWQRIGFIAFPLALCLTLLLPSVSEAHAILLRSDPAQDAVLSSAPTQVRMWFSEDLNPTFSTASVVNSANKRVDIKNAHVAPGDSREMDLSLQSGLQPSAYIVIWRTQSADDGHILSGSFLFSVANPDGSVPKFSGTLPGQGALNNGAASGAANGQLDGPTLFSFIMVTLVDLCTVFWVGAQLWRTFVQDTDEKEPGDAEEKDIQVRSERRFDRLFALPSLLILLLANIGVLVGQGLVISNGDWLQALSPATLGELAGSGRFGTYWTMREIVVLLAIVAAIYTLIARRRPRFASEVLSWINFVLALALLIALTLSGHAAASSANILIYAILVDWLHLLAASLWVGGMMYIATIYLPTLKNSTPQVRTRSLLITLPQFSPLAITGVIIMALSGPFNATVHITSIDQLFTTAYGRALDVKTLCVVALLATSAFHVLWLRPRLKKVYMKYASGASPTAAASAQPAKAAITEVAEADTQRSEDAVAVHAALQSRQAEQGAEGTVAHAGSRDERPGSTEGPEGVQEAKPVEPSAQLESAVAGQSRRLINTLRWEPLLGVAVLICTGLMNVFAGTLLPPPPPGTPSLQAPTTQVKPFTATATTSDKLYTVQVSVAPNRFGPNVFTIKVLDSHGKPDSNVGVSIYTTMLDMDMGTDTVNMQPDGKGGFTANGDLDMPGSWQLRIQIRTPDFKLHETKVKMLTPE